MAPINTLQWYYQMGVDETIANDPRDFSAVIEDKNNVGSPIKTEQSKPLVQPLIASNNNFTSPMEIMAEARKLANDAQTLAQLEEAVRKFDGCAIKRTATNTVFCDGNPESQIMFIGEAPGANEDIQGRPFCGDSGKLLDNMIATIGLNRSNVYITNSLFWRPPGNRRPTPEEIAICLPFVEKHIALVNPKLLILVGSTAVSSVLALNEPMTKMRKKFNNYNNQYVTSQIPTLAIFHPSYLLRQPTQKRNAWEDLLFIKQFIKENQIKLTY